VTIKKLLLILVSAIGVPILLVLLYFSYISAQIKSASYDQLEKVNHQERNLFDLQERLKDQASSLKEQNKVIENLKSIGDRLDQIKLLQSKYEALESKSLLAIVSRRVAQKNQYIEKSKDYRAYLNSLKQTFPTLYAELNQNLNKHIGDIDNAIIKFGGRNKSPATRLYLTKILPESNRIKGILDTKRQALEIQVDAQREAVKQSLTDLDQATKKMATAKTLVTQSATAVSESANQISGEANDLVGIAFAAIGLMVVVIPLIGLRMIRTILSPIHSAKHALVNISSQKNLALQVPKTWGEIGTLLSAVDSLLKELRGTFSHVRLSSDSFKKKATELNDIASKSASGTHEQLNLSNTLNHNLNTLNQSAQDTHTLMTDVQASIIDTQQSARVGSETINNSLLCFNDISKAVSQFQEETLALNKTVASVSTILQSVNEISRQTNLLALNAAIESARAGEHGRGFSVVAEEVRNLSQQTEVAVTEINSKLLNLQASVQNTEAVMESGLEISRKGTTLVSSAGSAINEIVNAIDAISESIIEATERSSRASSLSEEASEVLSKVKALADETNGISETLLDAASRCSKEANDLAENVRQYRVQ